MNVRSPRRDRRKGAALVEMAVVFPLLMLLILGIIEVGRLGMVSQITTTAAREGCRLAVLNGRSASDVTTRIDQYMESAGIDTYEVSYAPTDWQSVKSTSTSNFITVTVTVEFADVSWLPLPWFLNDAQVQGTATLCSERQ